MAQIEVTLEAIHHRTERKYDFPTATATTIGIGTSYTITPNGSGSIILDTLSDTEYTVSESVSEVAALIALPINVTINNTGNDGFDLDMNLQDQTTPTVDTYFLQSVSNFTVATDTPVSTVSVLEYDFDATSGHGITAGNEILLLDIAGDRSMYAVVMGVATDTITLDRPLDNSFPAATTLGRIVSREMAVNGAVTPQIFTVRGGALQAHDITRLFITMLDDSAMDDGKFGGISALTRGLVLRIVNGIQVNIFNFKTNSDIKQFCYDLTYSSKAAAGLHGLSARMSFGGNDKHGVVLRLDGLDALQWIVQDDLTALSSLHASAQGHQVE